MLKTMEQRFLPLILLGWSGLTGMTQTQDVYEAVSQPGVTAEIQAVEAAGQPQIRDPFWPAGYIPKGTPPAAQTTAVKPKATEPESITDNIRKQILSSLKIGGIVYRRGEHWAILNGLLVQAGDIVPVVLDGKVYKFRVKSIDMKRVRIEPME